MKLYLTQHGEAQAKEQNPERPLSQNGINDIKRLAQFLGQSSVQVQKIVHSGKLRAMQTADILGQQLGRQIPLESIDKIKPNDNPADMFEVLSDWHEDTLVVGHLPYMAKLVSFLTSSSNDSTLVAYQPGSMVCLESDEQGQWHINWMIRPELLH